MSVANQGRRCKPIVWGQPSESTQALVWRTPVKRFLIWAYCWRLIGLSLTQRIYDRLRLWGA
jgi:hypothetical protein